MLTLAMRDADEMWVECVYHPANGLDETTITRVERYLDAVRSTILFAKGVLLVEGDAEQILIPAMLGAVLGISADQLGFSVVSMSQAFFEHISIVFSEERIRRPCAIVTDRDASIIDLPEDPSDDDIEQGHARAADKIGLTRQVMLEAEADVNKWRQTFLADHTFEVDFLNAGNRQVAINTLSQIFKNQSSIVRSTQKLESIEIAIYGKEILRIAKKFGKGWFALLLAEKLTNTTHFPAYILKAIAFACHLSVTDAALRQMALFRMSKDTALASGLRGTEGYEDLSPDKFLDQYCSEETDDALTLFRGYIDNYRVE